MTTNDLKKGTKVLLNDGTEATLMDNKKGNIRLAEVFSIHTELGSIYTHIIKAYKAKDGMWEPVTLTESQKKLSKKLKEVFG